VWEQNIPKLGIFSNTPPENRLKITPIGRSHADYYVVMVVKNFNSKYAVLNGINKKLIFPSVIECKGTVKATE
jgi:hypothetical protein